MHLSFFSAFSGSVAIMFAIHYLIWTRGLLNNCKLTSGWWPQFLEIERDEVYALNEFIHLVSANKNDQDTLIVLFTPGQGGSYFQARSLYWEVIKSVQDGGWNSKIRLFTIDFREQLSALSTTIAYSQSQFIQKCFVWLLRLEPNAKFVVVSHSMGGIVSLHAISSLPQYISRHILSIIALASPLLIPPVIIDGGMNQFYNEAHKIWKDSNLDIAVISVSGGIRDFQIRSEWSTCDAIINQNSEKPIFYSTVAYSSQNIPKIGAFADHQCIVWCNQLLQLLTEFLREVDQQITHSTKDNFSRILTHHFVRISKIDLPTANNSHFNPYNEPRSSQRWWKDSLFQSFLHKHTKAKPLAVLSWGNVLMWLFRENTHILLGMVIVWAQILHDLHKTDNGPSLKISFNRFAIGFNYVSLLLWSCIFFAMILTLYRATDSNEKVDPYQIQSTAAALLDPENMLWENQIFSLFNSPIFVFITRWIFWLSLSHSIVSLLAIFLWCIRNIRVLIIPRLYFKGKILTGSTRLFALVFSIVAPILFYQQLKPIFHSFEDLHALLQLNYTIESAIASLSTCAIMSSYIVTLVDTVYQLFMCVFGDSTPVFYKAIKQVFILVIWTDSIVSAISFIGFNFSITIFCIITLSNYKKKIHSLSKSIII